MAHEVEVTTPFEGLAPSISYGLRGWVNERRGVSGLTDDPNVLRFRFRDEATAEAFVAKFAELRGATS